MWLPLILASHIPASRIDISRTEQQKNERKKRLFCSLVHNIIFEHIKEDITLILAFSRPFSPYPHESLFTGDLNSQSGSKQLISTGVPSETMIPGKLLAVMKI